MDDQQIVDLYWNRSECAISETAKKYGKYCHYIAYNILHNREDSEESKLHVICHYIAMKKIMLSNAEWDKSRLHLRN